MQVHNQVALVTGAGVRLGQAIAIQLAEMGMRIAVHYHRSREGAIETQNQLKGNTESGRHLLLSADLRSVEDLQRLVAQVEQELGPIAVLVNNAADFYPTPLEQTTEADWDHLFALNLKAPFFLAQAVAGSMKARGQGKIINLVDVSAQRPWPNYLPYCTTKAGLHALTAGLAKALAPEVQVNGIAPGTVLPPPASSKIDQSLSVERSLLKRMGSPEDIQRALKYLIESDFVTGTVMAVDGGRLLT
ncbi:MAG: SDR family NAD(P)-dependent oxidoreductase [bacterium]